MTKILRLIPPFLAQVVRRFRAIDGPRLAASLTFTTLLALVPLATIALTLFTAFPVFEQFTRGVDEFVSNNMLPPTVAATITRYITQFTEQAAGLTALGLVLLSATAFALMFTIERSFNDIWQVRRERPLGVRVLVYWGVLTLGPILVGASLSITSYVVRQSLDVTHRIPGAASVVLALTPLSLTAIAFTLLYFVVPNRRVELRHAVAGGVLAALMFEGMQRGLAAYIANFPSYRLVYGAFAAIPIFLIWMYLSWVVTVIGAIVTALLPDLRAAGAQNDRSPAATMRHALAVLRVLIRAQGDAKMLDANRIAGQAGVPRAALEPIVERLAGAGWVTRAAGDRWALCCDPGAVTVAEVFRRMVFRPPTQRDDDPVIADLMERAARGAEAALDAPLRALVAEPPGARREERQLAALN